MRKSLFCFDLAVCSLWTMAALGSRTAWFASPAMWIVMLLLVVSRILLSFTLYNRTRVRDKDCVKNRVKRAKIVRFTLC